jgi:hypothetical protein
MRKLGLLGLLAALALPLGRASDRPLPLVGPTAATSPLTGIVYKSGGAQLALVDPATLLTEKTALIPGGYAGGWVRSPDGTKLALATQKTLRFATPELEFLPGIAPLGGFFRTGIWNAPRTLIAVVQAGSVVGVETIDPVTATMSPGSSFSGLISKTGRWANGLWLLVAPNTGIKSLRLVAVAPDGVVRSASLARISGGSRWHKGRGGATIGDRREPALAVDPDTGTAYVVDPSGLVAVVDARSLVVRYHSPRRTLQSRLARWLTPPAEAKGLNGPTRTAQWLGDGLIAVFGTDATATNPRRNTFVYAAQPAGLRILDTHSWSYRVLDARADSAFATDGTLLATGMWWRVGRSAQTRGGSGIAGFSADGRLLWRLGDGGIRYVLTRYGTLAVVGKAVRGYDVVDVRTGTVVRSGSSFPQLLLGTGS